MITIESFIKNYAVQIKNIKSDYLAGKNGDPQGSIQEAPFFIPLTFQFCTFLKHFNRKLYAHVSHQHKTCTFPLLEQFQQYFTLT